MTSSTPRKVAAVPSCVRPPSAGAHAAWLLVAAAALVVTVTSPHPVARAQIGNLHSVPTSERWLRLPAPALHDTARFAAGTFKMGSTPDDVIAAYADCTREPLKQWCDPSQFTDETPVRHIRLSAFELQLFEVSAELYDRCVRAGRCRPQLYTAHTRAANPLWPATGVSWYDARDYCAFHGMRLPTEAEFERAARGTAGRKYPWGELYNQRVVNHGRLATETRSDSDGYLTLAPIDALPEGRSPEGLHHLVGNVAEWTWDRYAATYAREDVTDPQGPHGPNAPEERTLRGGHYESPASDLRAATRFSAKPDERRPTFGFRCAR